MSGTVRPISQDSTVARFAREALTLDEWAMKRFWRRVFEKHVFFEPEWDVSTEQPPRLHGTQRRVDIAIELTINNIPTFIAFVELKKGKAEPQDIAEVESQAFSACFEYYVENRHRTRLWAMTCYGTSIRIWIFDSRFDMLDPYYPAQEDVGERMYYVDFRDDELAIMQVLEYIKENPEPPSDSGLDQRALAGPSTSYPAPPLSSSGLGLAPGVLTEFAPVRVLEFRGEELVVEDRNGKRVRTMSSGWEEYKAMVGGEVVAGHKYTGNSGTVYFRINLISGGQD